MNWLLLILICYPDSPIPPPAYQDTIFISKDFKYVYKSTRPRVTSELPFFFPYRGIYLNYAAAIKIDKYLPYIRETEINCVVVDFKEYRGWVTYNTMVEFAWTIGAEKPAINLEQLVATCKREGLRLIGRVVCFQDSTLAHYKGGEYSLKTTEGKVWKDGHGLSWVNPCDVVVQMYNSEIAMDLAARGVDEIQFDYIRFPSATGKFKPYRLDCKDKQKTLADFLKLTQQMLSQYEVELAADIYGYVLWYGSLNQEAQNLELMAPWLDVINPMLYPSHFLRDHERSSNPRTRDYNLIFKSVAHGDSLIGESKFVPYIQGFDLRSPNFGPDYLANQIKACQDSGAWGYLVWNSRSEYRHLWEALKVVEEETEEEQESQE